MWQWCWHTWRRGGASLRRTWPVLAFSVAIAALGAGVVSGATAAVERDVLSSGGLTQIDLASFQESASTLLLTRENLREAESVRHVRSVTADYVSSIHAGEDVEGAFVLPTHVLGPDDELPIVAGTPPERLEPGEAVVPASADGEDLRRYVGQDLSIGYIRATGPNSGKDEGGSVRVVAAYDPSWQRDHPSTAYLAEATALEFAAARAGMTAAEYAESEGAASAVVVVDHKDNVRAAASELQRKGFAASPVVDRIQQLPGVLGGVQIFARALVGVLAVVALAMGFARARDSVRARLDQFGVLRILGAGVGDLRMLLLAEGLLTGVLAALVGTAVGALASVAAAPGVAALLGIPLSGADAIPAGGWLLACLLLPVASLAAGALLGGRVALRRDPYLVARAHS